MLVFGKDIVDDKEELCVCNDDYLDHRIGVDEDETNMNEVLRISWMKMQLMKN